MLFVLQNAAPTRSTAQDHKRESGFILDQGRFVPDGNLQAHAFCRIHDGLDCRLHDSAARQFHPQVVADFVFGHGYGITSSAKASQPCAALFYALFHLCAYSLKQHSRRQVCKVLLHPVCPFEEFGGDGLSVSGLESV